MKSYTNLSQAGNVKGASQFICIFVIVNIRLTLFFNITRKIRNNLRVALMMQQIYSIYFFCPVKFRFYVNFKVELYLPMNPGL